MCSPRPDSDPHPHQHARCCPCSREEELAAAEFTRRAFLGGAAAGGMLLTGLSWSALSAAEPELDQPSPRRPLRVKPIFAYTTYKPVPQRSWRSWGGIQTQEDVDGEIERIKGELAKMESMADFPVEFLPLAAVRSPQEVAAQDDAKEADVVLIYAANGSAATLEAARKLGKDNVFFVRHRSGPVSLWYEIISPRYLRQHTDELKLEGVDFDDVVVDELGDVVWRLRALCGLHNTLGSRIVCIGGAGGWAQPRDVVPNLVREKWNMDLQIVPYEEVGKLIQEARKDEAAVALAKRRAKQYLAQPGTKMETKQSYVENCMLLDRIFRRLMKEADCRAITIIGCMGTIMPLAETTACLTLSTLNDDGYLAFCESDFVVIPSGILLANISGMPVFLNDPTYPHHGMITLAHCTAPRRMDGKKQEDVRVVTHFESDYGAAPKVEMPKGQVVTNIVPDFKSERWLGFAAKIAEAPFLPICRSQIDVEFKPEWTDVIAERMPGFHWMTGYGDYCREVGYAIKRIPIEWDYLG
jgi:hypothetical protein